MHGARALWGRAHESPGMPSYYPWKRIGDANARFDEPAAFADELDAGQVSELVRIFPVLQSLPDVHEPQEIIDAEVAQFRLFDAYVAFLRAASARAPLLIVLDDLHWADKPSLLLLQHLARELSRMRVLVVGAFRDTELGRTHPLSEALAELHREAGFQRIVLRGLSLDEIAAYINGTAHIEPSPQVLRRIAEETEGNPFFLQQVVNLMTEEKTLGADAVSDIAVPDGVKEALGRRLDRLSEEANELLRVAAVAGREFNYETLVALGQWGSDALLRLIEESLASRVIEELKEPGRYQFAHAQMQETLQGELSTTRRVRIHGQIGETPERRWGAAADEHAPWLAHHFVESSTLHREYAERAVRYSRLAAKQAEAQAAWDEAAEHYEHILALAGGAEDRWGEDEAALLEALGRCYRDAGRMGPAWRALLSAVDLYRQRGDGAAQARATLELTRVHGPAHPKRQAALVHQALAALGDDEPRLEALLHAEWLKAILRPFKSPSEVAFHRARAWQLAQDHGYQDVQASIAHGDGVTAQFAGDNPLAAERCREAHELFEGAAMPHAAADSLLRAACNVLAAGRLKDAIDMGAAGLAYARHYHLRVFERGFVLILSLAHLHRGQFDRMTTALDSFPESGRNEALTVARALSRLVVGDRVGAVDALPEPGITAYYPSALVHAARAWVFLAGGDIEAARVEFQRMKESDVSSQDLILRWDLGSAAGTATEEPTAWPHARAIAAFLDGAFVELSEPGVLRTWIESEPDPRLFVYWGSPPLIRACAALALGEDERAEHEFGSLIVIARREGAPIVAGRCHQGLAEVMVRRGDLDAAVEHLDAALELFRKHGAKLYVDQVAARKLEVQGDAAGGDGTSIDFQTRAASSERPGSRERHPDSLTNREVEVLQLIAKGRTNREIADELVLSIRTVERHIGNIYRKTDRHGRAQATAYALANGLA